MKNSIISNNTLIISFTLIGSSCLYYFKNKNKNKNIISFKKNTQTCVDIVKGTSGSAGWDIFPDEAEIIRAGERKLVSTGLSINNMPKGYYLRIAPRSSLSCKGIDIGAGVVDSDYRGIIKVLIINNSEDVFPINSAIRIAQIIPEYCGNLNAKCLNKDNLTTPVNSPKVINTLRGTGGFGSTNTT